MTEINLEPAKILVVDDTPENLEIVGMILEQHHYDVYIAHSGQTALDLLRNVAVDLILLDVMMPEMDGFETCIAIRGLEQHRDTPIIFMTAKVDVESAVRGFELGAADYIRKPINLLELIARIKTQLELRQLRLKLEMETSTDPLTSLINRREMLRRIDYERVRHTRNGSVYSLVMIRVDQFQQINDSQGPDYGDQILIKIARILRANVRGQDSVARWGGHDFLILLPETGQNGAGILAGKLRLLVDQARIPSHSNQVYSTISVGIVDNSLQQSIDLLLADAGQALDLGKQLS